TRPILEAALDPVEPDPLARATLQLFLQILGTEAANLALKMLATGGVYLAGGIAQALRDALRTSPFIDAFTGAGRFSPMLERVPVGTDVPGGGRRGPGRRPPTRPRRRPRG